MAEDSKDVAAAALKRLRQVITLGALILAFAHLVWPQLAIDSVTLVLLVIALVPWQTPVFVGCS